jgi:hypothetical protein
LKSDVPAVWNCAWNHWSKSARGFPDRTSTPISVAHHPFCDRHVQVIKSAIVIGSIEISLLQATLPEINGISDTLSTP